MCNTVQPPCPRRTPTSQSPPEPEQARHPAVLRPRVRGLWACGAFPSGNYPLRQGFKETVSPFMRRTSCMSLGMIVTRCAWMAARLEFSNTPCTGARQSSSGRSQLPHAELTLRCASAASCSARAVVVWKRRSVRNSCAISRANFWKGSFLINRSVVFWYRRISLRALTPGFARRGFLTPALSGDAAFLAAFFCSALPLDRLPKASPASR
jgi:hypothetical protein